MGKYKGYPEYRESGVEWLGSIPSHWVITPLKYLMDLNPSKSSYLGSQRLACSFVPMEKLKKGSLTLDEERVIADVISGYTYFENGDVLQAKVTPCFENKNIAIAENLKNGIGFGSSEINVYRPYEGELVKSFLYYRCQEDAYMEFCTSAMIGAGGLKRVPSDTINNFPIALPTVMEQSQIAKFLDCETAKIDTLIGKQERLIELLREKRQAVISHAVTKGLDGAVEMKDSGVEWLGEVPEHWVVKSYRHACLIYRGKFSHRPRNDPSFYDGEYPFIQTGDVARANKVITSYSQTLNEKGKQVSQLFPAGTLVMTIAANIGDTAILGFEAYAPDSIVGFKPGSELELEFLKYSFMASFQALEQTSTQSTQANLNIDRIGAVKGAFPSLGEQRQIVSYLDKLLETYEKTENKAVYFIDKLKERRTALISAAVTGKIDVRDVELS